MSKIIGVAQLLFGIALIGGALLHAVSLIPSFSMAMDGSSDASIRLIVSMVAATLFTVWGIRSFKAGKTRLFESPEAKIQESIAFIERISAPSMKRGEQVAEDCYQNGLLNGKAVLLADMDKQIEEDYPHNPEAVKHGFLNRMLSYVQSGEILSQSMEGDNTLFVHRTKGKAVLQALLAPKDGGVSDQEHRQKESPET